MTWICSTFDAPIAQLQVPLPFGYHLDLDFLRVCSDELVSDETLQKLKELKRQRRKERKQLEALMGITQVLPCHQKQDAEHFLSAGTKGAGKAAADAGNAATDVADHEKEALSADHPPVEPT